jgi:O-antigen/teichoic acid export membrane protein
MLSKLRPKSSYARNVITLMTGTSLAQAIPIAISPILTRLYGPDDFGVFALFLAVTSILSILATGRYELAILLPKKDRDAIHVMTLSIALSCLVGVLLLITVFFFEQQIALLIDAPEIRDWLYWTPVSIMLTGIYQSLNYWSNRKAQFKHLAISRIVQSGTASLGQLGAGYISNAGSGGLIGGHLIGQAFSSAVLASRVCREDQALIRGLERNRVLALAKKYVRFPKYLILAHGFNTASSQLPVFLLGVLFSSATAGFYSLTQRVLAAPMTLVASALADVFRQEASHSFRHTGRCVEIYEKTFKRLLIVSTIPFLLFFFIAPDLFSFVFGGAWRTAGEYAQILTPMFFLRFITSPLSSMYLIAEKQKVDLIWQAVLLTLTVSSFFIGYLNKDIELILWLFSGSYCLMYAINGFFSYRLAYGK